MYQQITVVGRLGSDPEPRDANGSAVANFGVATTQTWTKDGKKQEKTVWFRVTAWRELAEFADKYLRKGKRVMAIGMMEEPRAYLDKEKNPAAKLEMTARELRIIDWPDDGDGEEEEQEERPARSSKKPSSSGSSRSHNGGGAARKSAPTKTKTSRKVQEEDEDTVPFDEDDQPFDDDETVY